jgi:ATP-dependent protease ClpP protease subunit
MPIDSSVAELLTAQLFVLVQDAPDPIYFYINSTGIAVSAVVIVMRGGGGSHSSQPPFVQTSR